MTAGFWFAQARLLHVLYTFEHGGHVGESTGAPLRIAMISGR